MGRQEGGRVRAWAALAALGLLLLIGLPQFVRMPLYCDTTHWDVCARSMLHGGVFYRDTFETNLPGMVWPHMAVRALFGWSPEALRVADLVVLGGVLALMLRGLQQAGMSSVSRLWTAVALVGFYFSVGEDCHCQRDLWMLLPAALALRLRCRQVAQIGTESGSFRVLRMAAFEGACWGLACWIKPHVIVVAALCWLLSLVLIWRAGSGKRSFVDAGGLLAGGLVAGGLGCAWLWQTGAWPYFWQTMLSWSLEYSTWQAPKWALRALVIHRFGPWVLAHLVALPLAIAWVYRALRSGEGTGEEGGPGPRRERGLLGGFYLAWLGQADLLQHGTPYHHVPALLLALAVAACWYAGRPLPVARWVLLLVFAVVAVGLHPMFQGQRLSAWSCFVRDGDAAMKDRLALTETTDWQDLERVAAYLRTCQLHDGELCCYGTYTIPLYLWLQVQPATRFIEFDFVLAMFPARQPTVYAETSRSRQRYVVSDVKDGWAIGLAGGDPVLPPPRDSPAARSYPWSVPIVFRAGRYCVHQVNEPIP